MRTDTSQSQVSPSVTVLSGRCGRTGCVGSDHLHRHLSCSARPTRTLWSFSEPETRLLATLVSVTDAATRRLAYVDALIAYYKTLAELDAAGVESGARVAELTDARRAARLVYDVAREAFLEASRDSGA